MSKFSHFAVKNSYFKRSFNNINGNRGPLFSQINFDRTYFWGVLSGGGGSTGWFLSRGFLSEELCPGTTKVANFRV